jgi:hypothetical protein
MLTLNLLKERTWNFVVPSWECGNVWMLLNYILQQWFVKIFTGLILVSVQWLAWSRCVSNRGTFLVHSVCKSKERYLARLLKLPTQFEYSNTVTLHVVIISPLFSKNGEPQKIKFYRRSTKVIPFYISQMLWELQYPPAVLVILEDAVLTSLHIIEEH